MVHDLFFSFEGFEEDRVFCFLDYSDNASCDHAIRIENGKQIGRHQIIVQRCSNTGSSDVKLLNLN